MGFIPYNLVGVVSLFHKAVSLSFLPGTELEVLFSDGKARRFDMSVLFSKYPQLEALRDRSLFLSGRLNSYGIIWNDDLDIEAETIYEEGVPVRGSRPAEQTASAAVLRARAQKGLSQKQLAALTGIDQADISRIERGLANPSVSTLDRIAAALGGRLSISIDL